MFKYIPFRVYMVRYVQIHSIQSIHGKVCSSTFHSEYTWWDMFKYIPFRVYMVRYVQIHSIQSIHGEICSSTFHSGYTWWDMFKYIPFRVYMVRYVQIHSIQSIVVRYVQIHSIHCIHGKICSNTFHSEYTWWDMFKYIPFRVYMVRYVQIHSIQSIVVRYVQIHSIQCIHGKICSNTFHSEYTWWDMFKYCKRGNFRVGVIFAFFALWSSSRK